MPNPIPLATKEEEERRAWVTAHHEVVRLVKDCFGDRFSNNEIFDRLKISRRTGYRALGNDERIGKAPGRKPKIAEDTIKAMIEYIEHGGCSDVGNVWKHLAEKFAPDCNPKTVQDAVKKSGFKNYQNQVKLDPLLNQQLPDNQPTPNDEADQHAQFALQQATQTPQEQQSLIDPAFHHAPSAPEDVLRNAIATAPPDHIRMVLQDISSRFAEASQIASAYLCPFASHYPVPSPVAHMGTAHMQHSLHVSSSHSLPHDHKRRLAICRRCGQQYDRAENTMEKRECLYHKGSPQKIAPEETGAIESSPEAYIWSCCGGNGMVRGCCRAMHTTKKKRKYSKKRDAATAGLDEGDSDVDAAAAASFMQSQRRLDDSNIDTTLQDELHPTHMALASLQQTQMQLSPGTSSQVQLQHHQAQHLQEAARHLQQAAMQGDAYGRGEQGGADSTEDMEAQLQAGLQQLESNGVGDHHHGLSPEIQLQQLQASQQQQQQQPQQGQVAHQQQHQLSVLVRKDGND